MPKTWKQVRAEAAERGRIDEAKVAEHREAGLASVRAYRLAELRKRTGFNQEEIAQKVGVTQSRVSRIERGDIGHTELGTLRAFTEAFGGELEVVVKLGDERVVLV
ncbi:helix-turn-helix domain-containing protein [Deinococcus peraridilitoris]|uniref:Putative transcriptional regulator with C-terminal CBS domains n=1 Tax=Deinococcus peraridilitoris (strain DSM 19664 / LMG 22246 / CIP 109416 / KR-200) TaxID=937777 RepID=L0A903_DEIPD|nr:helix-turn-helix domain-containing protein [Deinococcus peraridilitoris]AFZ69597.1 putative transcriptional regulator with C-terminal CBS domains [Deinococcus peraridilitoris DSM 19664]